MSTPSLPQQTQHPRAIAAGTLRSDLAPRPAGSPLVARNRRRHPRVEARGVASHIQSVHTQTPGLPVEDISLGGLFVRAAIAPAPGTAVMLQLVRPGLKRAIQLTGQVVAVVTPAEARERGAVAGMRIRLDNADPETEHRLRALIEDLFAAAGRAPAGTQATAAAPRRPEAPAAAPQEPEALPLVLTTLRDPMIDFVQAEPQTTAVERQIAQMEAEIRGLRRELLRRNRTIVDMATKLAALGAT